MQREKQAHDRGAKEHNFEPSPRVWVDITELQISSRRCDYTNWTSFLEVNRQMWHQHADQVYAGATNQPVE